MPKKKKIKVIRRKKSERFDKIKLKTADNKELKPSVPIPKTKKEAQILLQHADEYEFRPTKKQIEFAEVYIKLKGALTMVQVAKQIDVDLKGFYKWKMQPGFKEWIYETVRAENLYDFIELHNFGLAAAMQPNKTGFAYWKIIYENMFEALGLKEPQKHEINIKGGVDVSHLTDEQIREKMKNITSQLAIVKSDAE